MKIELERKKEITRKTSLREKGITLIALTITIVVLIILAGVAISLSLGENGLFNKAKTASEEYTNAQKTEETEIAEYSNEIEKIVNNRGDFVSKADYDELLERVEKLEQQENSNNGTVDIISTNDGSAINTEGVVYQLNKSINDYKFLIIFSATDNAGNNGASTIIAKQFYNIGTNQDRHCITNYGNASYNYRVRINFPTENSIKYTYNIIGWSNPRILYILGIK